MSVRKPWKHVAGVTVLLVLDLIVMAVLATRKSQTLGLHQPLQFGAVGDVLEWLVFGRKQFHLPSGRSSASVEDAAK